ncbi:MAG: cupin domain-containing protein [Acidimicrobiales bacterium]
MGADDEPVHNPVTGERFFPLTTGAATGGAYVEGRGVFPAGARPPGTHRHRNQDESITVVSGRVRARVGNDERELGPGGSVVLPLGVWHDFWVVGDETAELVLRATPALGIELLLGTLAGLAREGRTDRRGRPRPLQGAVIGQFYRDVAEFKAPPPAVQRVVLPPMAALGRRLGLRPYYERHFRPGQIESILAHWYAHPRG